MDGKRDRLWSLDTLRGFDMLFISGLGGAVYELAILLFGGSDAWLAQQMKHVAWEGFHQHDTIFPLFIFLAGVSYPFSCASARTRGLDARALVGKATRRLLALVLLGFVYNGVLQFDFAHQRWPSVLGRIGMAWYVAALLYLFVRNVWIRVLIAVGILVGYWVVCAFAVAPDAAVDVSPFTPEGCFSGYVDRLLIPGTLGEVHLDPEGVLSVFPAAVLAMGGCFAGELVRCNGLSGLKKTLMMLGGASLLALVTWAWLPLCPIIKKIWTPTFVTASLAYSLIAFSLFYLVVDVFGVRKWTLPLRVVGMNALIIYLFNRIVPVARIAEFFFGGFISLFPSSCANLLINFAVMVVSWGFLYFLYRKNVFLKV